MSHKFTSVVFVEPEDVISIYNVFVRQNNGLYGLRDHNLLESAVNQVFMIAKFGQPEERTIHHLAAAYFFHIIKNHPFLDGNKRTGLITATLFLAQNGFSLEIPYDDLYQLAIDTASSQVSKQEIAGILQRTAKLLLR